MNKEVKAALAWAEGLTMSHKSDHAEFMAQKLASALRESEAECISCGKLTRMSGRCLSCRAGG